MKFQGLIALKRQCDKILTLALGVKKMMRNRKKANIVMCFTVTKMSSSLLLKVKIDKKINL